MARTTNLEERDKKRNEILTATQRLLFTKGYENMTIQDILSELRISSGAFYHYFSSKPALLEAFIERIRMETEQRVLPIVNDPRLSALAKLQRFLTTLDSFRLEHRADVTALLRVWYLDANAIVRQKVEAAVFRQRAPLLAEVVRQGIREGVFSLVYSDYAGELVLSLLQGMGNVHAEQLLRLADEADEGECRRLVEAVVSVHAAYMDAVERVLGAAPDSLYRVDSAAVQVWVTQLKSPLPDSRGPN